MAFIFLAGPFSTLNKLSLSIDSYYKIWQARIELIIL